MPQNTDQQSRLNFDFIVIGGGPAGHQGAIVAAKSGASVLLIDASRAMGGACVHRGTIPSKTLRETAMAMRQLEAKSGGVVVAPVDDQVRIESLMKRKGQVLNAHASYLNAQLERNGVHRLRGRARFVNAHELCVRGVRGEETRVHGRRILIATGSRPRKPPEIPVDHQHILDSDSVLSLTYLPRSLIVLGGGVIASEYASIFAALGVEVTMVDRGERPLAFLDSELTSRFVSHFERLGGRFLPRATAAQVAWDGASSVRVQLGSGEELVADKLLSAIGRVPNVEWLALDHIGIECSKRGHIQVDNNFRTSTPHIYAAGDVIGFPALASTSTEQGRRAACDALDVAVNVPIEAMPVGVYTIPEIASVGLDEAAARALGPVVVGRARLSEIARGHIAATEYGLLKLVVDAQTQRVLGAQAICEGAAELVHIGQMALIGNFECRTFVDATFNFPTLAESYRVAALDIMEQLTERRAVA